MRYCVNCGAKAKKDDIYCGECGAKIEEQGEKEDDKKKKNRRKSLFLILVLFLFVVIFGYQYLGTKYSPENVTKNYMDAIVHKNANQIMEYLTLEKDRTFVPKKKLLKTIEDTLEEIKIENYKISDITYKKDKLNAEVTVQYTMEGSISSLNETIHLVKRKDKFLGIFDRWEVNEDNTETFIVKEYRIRVPVGSKVTVDEIELDKKYWNQKESTEELDVYLLPQVIRTEIDVKTTLKNGLELEEKVTPTTRSKYYTAKLSLDSLSEDSSKKIEEMVKKDIEKIYESLRQKQTWEEYRKQEDNEEIGLQEKYESLKEELEKNQEEELLSFEIKNLYLNQITTEGFDEVKITGKGEYEYETNNEEKEKQGKFTPNLIYKIEKGNMKLIDINYFVSYFK